MLQLDVVRLLKMKGHTKYWLWQRIGMSSYHNFNRMIENQTQSIRYDMLEGMCKALDCTPNDLFSLDYTIEDIKKNDWE